MASIIYSEINENLSTGAPNHALFLLNKFFSGKPTPNYDPYAIPASIKKAKFHAQASKVRKSTNHILAYKSICDCCSRSSQSNRPIPFCSNDTELKHLGYGPYAYFKYLKYLMVLFSVLALIAALPIMLLNQSCDNNDIPGVIMPTSGYGLIACFIYKQNIFLVNCIGILNTIGIIVFIIITILFITKSLQYYKEYMKNTEINRDFSWIITWKNRQQLTRQQFIENIREKLQKKLKSSIPPIIKVQFLPDFTEFKKMASYYKKWKPIMMDIELEAVKFIHAKTFSQKLSFFIFVYLLNRLHWLAHGLFFNKNTIKTKLDEIIPELAKSLEEPDAYFQLGDINEVNDYDDDSIINENIKSAIITFDRIIESKNKCYQSSDSIDLGQYMLARLIKTNPDVESWERYLFFNELGLKNKTKTMVKQILTELYHDILFLFGFIFGILLIYFIQNKIFYLNIELSEYQSINILLIILNIICWSLILLINKLIIKYYFKFFGNKSIIGASLILLSNVIFIFFIYNKEIFYIYMKPDSQLKPIFAPDSAYIIQGISNINYIFFTYNIIYPLYKILDIKYLIKLIMRKNIINQSIKQNQNYNNTTNSANSANSGRNDIDASNNHQSNLPQKIDEFNPDMNFKNTEISFPKNKNEITEPQSLDNIKMIQDEEKNKVKNVNLNAMVDNISQNKANKIFEGIKFDLDERCTYTTANIFGAIFFIGFIPHLILIVFIGFVLNLFIDKYILIKRSVVFDSRTPLIAMIIMTIFPLIHTIGFSIYLRIFIDYFDEDIIEIYSFIMGVLSILSAFILTIIILYKLNGIKKSLKKVSYREVCLNFHPANDAIPPIFQKSAQIQYLKRIKNFINQGETDTNAANLIEQKINLIEQLSGEQLINYILSEDKIKTNPDELELMQHMPIQLNNF